MKNSILSIVLQTLGCCIALLISATSQGESNQNRSSGCKLAPQSLNNMTMVLTIESLEGDNQAELPSTGVLVQRYRSHNELSFSIYGDSRVVEGQGTYRYKQRAKERATETMVDASTSDTITTRYRFTSATRGTWRRTWRDRSTVLSGSFVLNDSGSVAIHDTAPTSYADTTIALSILQSLSSTLPEGAFPGAGTVVLQEYNNDGSYQAKGFGPGTVDHAGTYTITKVAPNVILEETIQTIPDLNFTAPYTLIYIYETTYSGVWYQNFANGLIIFSGTFTRFPTQAN